MKELTLHLLDIVENSISAKAKNIFIKVEENLITDRLILLIKDDGIGMDADTVRKIVDPFVTSRTTRKVGLGIPLLKAAAEACNGEFSIQSEKGKGTTVQVEFQHSHIDRMPLGDLTGTLMTLVVGSPEIHWVFQYCMNQQEFIFDDQPIKDQLVDIPLSDPQVLSFLRNFIQEGIAEAKSA